MNIVRKLTLRHLKENKGRTVITSLGIIIAVAMLTAVFVGFASVLNIEGQLSLIDSGNYHCECNFISHSSYEKLKNDSRVDVVGMNYCSKDGKNCSFKLADTDAKLFNTSLIEAVDETLFHQMYNNKFKGTAPKDETQCAVTQDYIENNKLDWKIGDTITVDIGTVYAKIDGEKGIVQEKNISKNQSFEKSFQKQMTLTGIITASSNLYCDICRGMTEEEKLADNANVYFTLKEVDSDSREVLFDIAEKCGIDEENCFPNGGYLNSKFSFSKETLEMYSEVLMLGGIMLIIIMVAGVMLIYNSFSMSLANKVRYLGLLSSVGATKKQKRSSVYFEGFFLALISIPIGILSGIAGIGVTLHILLNRLISSGALFRNLDIDMFESVLSVPLWCIVGVIIFAFITIFISAFIPARKASKISPIDAIRQTNEIKLKARSLKSSKLIRLIFGYEGEIANKNIKRNGKKSKLIVFSIIISVVLFLTVGYFSDSLRKSTLYANSTNYQVRADVDYDESKKFEKDLETVKDIKDYYYGNSIKMYAKGNDLYDYDSKYYKNLITDDYQYTFNNGTHWNLHLIDDESFNKILSDNKIDKKSYYRNKIKALVVNAIDDKTTTDEPYFKDSAKGKTITISDFSCEINFNSETEEGPAEGKVEIGDFIKYDENDPLFTADGGQKVTLIAPMSVYVDVVNCIEPSNTFAIITDNPHEVTKDILEIADVYCENIAEEMQAVNSVLFVINVLVYGFIVLITLITMFNIINTISTGILMRRKEFAMLRSVGISKGGYYRIVSFESLLYGVKGLVFGLPIATAVCYLINYLISENQVPFEINWLRYLVVIIAVFAVVGITMLYAVFKTRKSSIIDTLKEDIN